MEITCPVSHSEVVLVVVGEYHNCSATFLCFRQTYNNTQANEGIARNNVIDAFKWQKRSRRSRVWEEKRGAGNIIHIIVP